MDLLEQVEAALGRPVPDPVDVRRQLINEVCSEHADFCCPLCTDGLSPSPDAYQTSICVGDPFDDEVIGWTRASGFRVLDEFEHSALNMAAEAMLGAQILGALTQASIRLSMN